MSVKRVGPPLQLPDRDRSTIRLVPALNLAVLRSKPRQDKQLWLWYCLRAIDVQGRGVMAQEEAIHMLKSTFGYKRQTAYKHLQVGDNIYWHRHTTRKGQAIIILHSLLRVAQNLEANIRGRERFIELPLSVFPASRQVQARRALLYNAAAYKPPTAGHSHPISRKSLEEKTEIEARQQRRYDQIIEAHSPVREPTSAFCRDRETGRLRKLVRLAETDRGLVLTHQLPNRYRPFCPGGSKGMLPKVARSLTVANQSFIRGEANFARHWHRRYYRDVRSFSRAALRGKATEGYYPGKPGSHKYIVETIS